MQIVAAGPRSTLGPVKGKPSFSLTRAAVATAQPGPQAPGGAADGSGAVGTVSGVVPVGPVAPWAEDFEAELQAPSSRPPAATTAARARR